MSVVSADILGTIMVVCQFSSRGELREHFFYSVLTTLRGDCMTLTTVSSVSKN